MLVEFFRSPEVIDTFLLLMLLGWLGGSAIMTLLSRASQDESLFTGRERVSQASLPPQARAITGAPRA